MIPLVLCLPLIALGQERFNFEVSEHVISVVDRLLESATWPHQYSSGIFSNGLASRFDINATTQMFYFLIKSIPSLRNIYAGYEDGEFVGVIRGGSAFPILQATYNLTGDYMASHRAAGSNSSRSYFEMDAKGLPTTFLLNSTYDPRVRQWYNETRLSNVSGWFGPYVFASLAEPGMTFAVPLFNSTGLDGVLAVDFSLYDISQFLENMYNSTDRVVKIIDSANNIIGTSTGDDLLNGTNLVTASSDPMLRKVLQQQPFAANDSVLVLDHQSIQARHYHYNLPGINWKLIVAMPAAFVGDNGITAVYTDNTTETVVNYTQSVTNTSNGIQITIPRDPSYGSLGTFQVAVSKPTPPAVSSVVTINFLNSQSVNEQTISNLSAPIRFIIPLDKGAAESVTVCDGTSPQVVVPECHWYDPDTATWSTSGCSSVLTFSHVECTCTHLTDFALVSPDYNRVPAQELLELSPDNVRNHPEGLITIGTVLCMFAFVLVTSIRTDVHEKRRPELKAVKYAKWDQALQSARAHNCANFWKQYKTGLQVHHTWASLLWRKSGTSFRSVDRAFVTLLLLLIVMSMSARFHARDHALLPTGLVIFYSMLATLLPTQFLTYLFLKTGEVGFREHWLLERNLKQPPKNRCAAYRFPSYFRFVWYTAVLSCALGMILYILSITMMFDQNPWYYCRGKTTLAWLWDFMASYAFVVLVVEPLKIVCFTALRVWTSDTRIGRVTQEMATRNSEDHKEED